MDIGAMIEQATGGGNAQALEQAAEQHLASMGSDEIKQHLETAAANSAQNGDTTPASEIQGMIARHQLDPDDLKSAAVSYIKSNPQILTHFAPSFAQGLLNRVV